MCCACQVMRRKSGKQERFKLVLSDKETIRDSVSTSMKCLASERTNFMRRPNIPALSLSQQPVIQTRTTITFTHITLKVLHLL